MEIYNINTFDFPWPLEDDSIQAIITSPPYYSKRCYSIPDVIIGGNKECKHEFGKNNVCTLCGAWLGQYGNEPDFGSYIRNTLLWCKEVYRVMKPEGLFFLNVGDSYVGSNNGSGIDKGNKISSEKYKEIYKRQKTGKQILPNKCKLMLPERIAIALCDELGFILRNHIIWKKTATTPECLDPNITVIIKHKIKHFIENITLEDLINKNSNDYFILSPDGWKNIINIWKVVKNNYCVFDAGRFTHILCGTEHRFPMTKEIRYNAIYIEKIEDIKSDSYSNYLLTKTIDHGIEENTKELNLLDIAQILQYPLNKIIINFDKTVEKLLQINKNELVNKYKNKVIKKQLYQFLYKNKLSADIVINENIKIDNESASFYNHKNYEPLSIKLDYNTGKFLGIYIAEGGTSKYQSKLTFNKNEHNVIKFVADFLGSRNLPINIYTKNNYTSIQFNASLLKLFFNYFVEGKCKNKKLFVNRILNTNKNFIKGIFEGYLIGDGSVNAYGFSVASASEQLISDMQIIGSACGFLLSKYNYRGKDKRSNKFYNVSTLKTAYPNRKSNKLGTPIRIKHKTIYNKEKELIDIEVEGGLFIINNGIISHNSVKDRYSSKTESIFMFSKNKNYYFDLASVLEPFAASTYQRGKAAFTSKKCIEEKSYIKSHNQQIWHKKLLEEKLKGKNPGNVWYDNNEEILLDFIEEWKIRNNTIPTKEDIEAVVNLCRLNIDLTKIGDLWEITKSNTRLKHYAAFSTQLVERMIKCSTKVNDAVLDPFCGSGSTLEAAKKLHRKSIGFDLGYTSVQQQRLTKIQGTFVEE